MAQFIQLFDTTISALLTRFIQYWLNLKLGKFGARIDAKRF